MKSSFPIKINPSYKYLNFTEDDIRYILYNYYLKPLKKYNNHTINTVYSIAKIIGVSYSEYSNINSYLFTISYKNEYMTPIERHVFKEHIHDYLLFKKRNIKLQEILHENVSVPLCEAFP